MFTLRNALLLRHTSTWKSAAVCAALLIACCAPSARAQECLPEGSPQILVLRGVFEIFSLGMNDLAHKLRCRGYDATSTSWSLALFSTDCSGDRPVIVIGHSLGGRMCGWTSRLLKSCGQRVPLVIVVDANLLTSIPSNVDECLNLYVTNELGIFHGSPVRAESPHTSIVNWDVSRGQPSMFLGGVNHFDIDATDWVHDIIIREIECRFPLCCDMSGGMLPDLPADMNSEMYEHFSSQDCTAPSLGTPRLISRKAASDQNASSNDPSSINISDKDVQQAQRADVTRFHVLRPDEDDPFDVEERSHNRMQWQPIRPHSTEVVGVTESAGRVARGPWQPARPHVVITPLNR